MYNYVYPIVLCVPTGKIAKKAVYRGVLLTTWHCILSAELTNNAFLQTFFFLAILPTGVASVESS